MTLSKLTIAGAIYYWRTNVAVVLGVAAAVAVLAGALVVGDSVRGSLRDIALGRLGHTDQVLSSMGFFREALADDARNALGASAATPLIVADAFVTLESNGQRASNVTVYGVDERFWNFHGLPVVDGAFVSPALAAEVTAKEGDVLLTRLQKPSEVPIESLFGRKEDIGRTVRLTLAGVLPRDRLGEFSISRSRPTSAPFSHRCGGCSATSRCRGRSTRSCFQETSRSDQALRSALRLEDLGVQGHAARRPAGSGDRERQRHRREALESAARATVGKLGPAAVPVFTYLANTIRKGDRQIPYSLVTATDLDVLRSSVAQRIQGSYEATPIAADAIVLNEWAAKELAAVAGDRIEVDYYLWDHRAAWPPAARRSR